MAKTKLEQIAEVDERIRQLENQKKKYIQDYKIKERKARTKRLIERGAILESVIDDPEALTNEQIKQYLEKTLATDFSRRILISLKERTAEVVTEKSAELAQSGDEDDSVRFTESPQSGDAIITATTPEMARRAG